MMEAITIQEKLELAAGRLREAIAAYGPARSSFEDAHIERLEAVRQLIEEMLA